MKFSIIVPVYNVEKYIDKCLDSILNQTYKSFEVIIVNDGTQDNSQSIIDKYVKKDKRFKSYIKENGGLSDARNYGIGKSNGDVILFIDGDDYVDEKLLERLEREFAISKDIDVVRFQLRLVDEKYNKFEQPGYSIFSNVSATDSYKLLLKNVYVDVACAYAYRRYFFISNKFEYTKGKIHEDLGLTHLILVKSNHISSIDYVGYNYVQREGSIMTSNNRKHNLRKVYDTLFHFDNYLEVLQKDSTVSKENKDLLINYLIKSLMWRSVVLEKKDFNKYIRDLKKRKLYQYFPNNTFKDKLRRLSIKYFLKYYVLKNM